MTINDVIAHVGAHSADFAHSQKCFRIATILVTKGAPAPVEVMRQYDFFAARASATTPLACHDGLAKGTAKPFSLLTHGVGCLLTRIKRHILVDASRVWWFLQTAPSYPLSRFRDTPLPNT